MEEDPKTSPKTCFNCSTQSANYYQKWRGNVVCHRCYMRLFREKKKNEQAARDCLSTEPSIDGSFCLSGNDQNNNGNEEKNVMLNTFPVPSDTSSETNNQLETDNVGATGGGASNGANGSTSNTKQTKVKSSKTNHLVSGLIPPANIDTSIFKKPVTEQEAQASMIKSLNAAHYYAGYYEAMKQFKK